MEGCIPWQERMLEQGKSERRLKRQRGAVMDDCNPPIHHPSVLLGDGEAEELGMKE